MTAGPTGEGVGVTVTVGGLVGEERVVGVRLAVGGAAVALRADGVAVG